MTGLGASTRTTRGLLFPLLASIAFHGVVLSFPAAPAVSTPETEEAPFIELSFSEAPETGDPAGQAGGPRTQSSAGKSEAALPSPTSRVAALPAASRDADLRPAVHRATAEKKPTVVSQAPSAADVLADAMALTGTRGSLQAGAAADRPADGARRVEQELGWEGQGRTLLRRVDPQFPERLAIAGVEADCEARIAVSPAGNVVRVEITRGSGYIEIDRNVEAALRRFLFSRADSGSDAAGTVRFRFRLGKRE